MIVGVDIGGTKTHFRAYGEGPEPAADHILPTSQWRMRDWTKDAEAIVAQVRQFTKGGDVAAMAIGAHGCDDADECAAFERAFIGAAEYPVRVLNDAELLPARFGFENGIGLVAGTGSIAVTRNPDGKMLVAGGWGWILGDDGSASGLVREASRRACLHVDTAGTVNDPLIGGLCEVFGVEAVTQIGRVISEIGNAAGVGRYAHVVFDAAKQGSPLAQEVIDTGAGALVELIVRLKQRGAVGTEVVAGGAVITSQPMFADAFLERIERRFRGTVSAQLIPGPPVDGACRLALGLARAANADAAERDFFGN